MKVFLAPLVRSILSGHVASAKPSPAGGAGAFYAREASCESAVRPQPIHAQTIPSQTCGGTPSVGFIVFFEALCRALRRRDTPLPSLIRWQLATNQRMLIGKHDPIPAQCDSALEGHPTSALAAAQRGANLMQGG